MNLGFVCHLYLASSKVEEGVPVATDADIHNSYLTVSNNSLCGAAVGMDMLH
jgi:hypothetical protein